jgi:hypothetical protein
MAADGTTPSLATVLAKYAKGAADSVYTALPAKVIAYDPTTQKATVQPSVKLEGVNGEKESLPIVGGVPILFPNGGGYRIVWPIIPGDTVTLLFCSASIEDWLIEVPGATEPNEPASNRRHSLSDAVAIPGLRAFTDPLIHPVPLSMRMGGDVMKLEILESGLTLTIGGTVMQILINEATASITIGGATLSIALDETARRIDVGGANAAVVVDNLASEVRVGDDLATSYIAKADLVLTALTQLMTWINLHSHPPPFGSPPSPPLLWTPPGAPPNVAATKGKVT